MDCYYSLYEIHLLYPCNDYQNIYDALLHNPQEMMSSNRILIQKVDVHFCSYSLLQVRKCDFHFYLLFCIPFALLLSST